MLGTRVYDGLLENVSRGFLFMTLYIGHKPIDIFAVKINGKQIQDNIKYYEQYYRLYIK